MSASKVSHVVSHGLVTISNTRQKSETGKEVWSKAQVMA